MQNVQRRSSNNYVDKIPLNVILMATIKETTVMDSIDLSTVKEVMEALATTIIVVIIYDHPPVPLAFYKTTHQQVLLTNETTPLDHILINVPIQLDQHRH